MDKKENAVVAIFEYLSNAFDNNFFFFFSKYNAVTHKAPRDRSLRARFKHNSNSSYLKEKFLDTSECFQLKLKKQ